MMYDKWGAEKSGSSSSSSSSKTKSTVLNDFSGGLNLTPAIYTLKNNESRDNENLSAEFLPAICPKNESSLLKHVNYTDIKSIGVLHNGHLFITRKHTSNTTEIIDIEKDASIGLLTHDGLLAYNAFYYFQEFAQCTAFFTSTGQMRILYPNGVSIGTSELAYPVNFSCVHQGRIAVAALNRNVVYVAKQSHADYMSENYDAIKVGSTAEGSRGIMSHKGSILYWSPTTLYKINTNYPSIDVTGANDDYKHNIQSLGNGCGACVGNTIVDVLGTIIWYGNGRIYTYKGSNVEVISHNIQTFLNQIDEDEFTYPPVAGNIGEYYYLVFNFLHRSVMLTYDTKNKSWLIADGEDIISFTKKNQDLIALTANGEVKNLSKKAQATKPWSYKSPYFSRSELSGTFSIKADLERDATATVYIRADGYNEPFLIGTITYENNDIEKTFSIPNEIAENAKLSIELEGNGKTIIHAISL